MNIAELMREMGGDRHDHDDESLTDMQVINRLRDVFEKMGERHEFKPGDVIMHKWPSLSDTRSAKAPALFVKYMDEEIKASSFINEIDNVFSNAAPVVFDCVILRITRQSASTYFANSAEYRPYDEAE